MNKIISWIVQIGSSPEDDENTGLKKSMLVICSFVIAVLAAGWGGIYILLDEQIAGMIPIAYCIISLLSISFFGYTRKYKFFRFSQLLLTLLLPFFLMITLGGFINGSAVLIWSLSCPMGALLFDKLSHAKYWFASFVMLAIASGILQPFLNITSNLSPEITTAFFVMNLSAVGGLLFLLVHFFVGQKEMFQEQSETLLLNILPKEIVTILKQKQRTIADHFEGASILFADLVNFTSMSERMSPIALVELLNELFSHFDGLVEKYDLEKIKTIGDCYMVASGVPRPRKDHAELLTTMAIDMREYISKYDFNGKKLSFRIGMNSGPVVAGVIGSKKFIYDLWGDAVNTASRMESHGQGGVIQITRATYELIKDAFICEPQGTVHVKGKGEMEVWYVHNKIA